MQKFKRILVVVFSLVIVLSIMAGCEKTTTTATETKTETTSENDSEQSEVPEVVIACGWSQIGEQELLQQQYYKEVLGPELGITFVFSPVLASDEEIIDFLENASVQGAVGFLDMASSSNDSANIVAEKCDELEMYDVSWMTSVQIESDYFLGMVSADGEFLSTAFHEMMMNDLKDDGETHNMLLFSFGSQYRIPKHLYTSLGALNAFNDLYDLGMTDEEMEALAVTQERVYVDTGRDDVKICVDPFMVVKSFNEQCSEDLKNGDYDVIVASDSFYLQMTTAIAEAEQELGFDIKVYSNSSIVGATQTAFDTQDSFGNSSLNQAMLKTSANGIIMMAVLLNGVYGDKEFIVDNEGNYKLYNVRFMKAGSAEDYAKISKIDHDGNWMFSIDTFKQMLKVYNDEVTYEWLQNYINENVGYDAVMERLGFN